MTEHEWLASTTPLPMLEWLAPRYRTRNRYCYRTALLFGVACLERGIGYPGNSENWLLRCAEELADGIADAEPHITAAHTYFLSGHPSTQPLLLLVEPKDRLSPVEMANAAAELGRLRRRMHSGAPSDVLLGLEQEIQAKYLREIIGNPFRRFTCDRAWRTSDVMLLAQGIYNDSAFDRMPILADALQDAGCDNSDILDHCRDTSLTHVRGCWVVDLVLGKS